MIATLLMLVGGTVIATTLLGIAWYCAGLWRATRRERLLLKKRTDGQWISLDGGHTSVWVANQRRAAVAAAATDCESCLPPGVREAVERGERVEFSISDD